MGGGVEEVANLAPPFLLISTLHLLPALGFGLMGEKLKLGVISIRNSVCYINSVVFKSVVETLWYQLTLSFSLSTNQAETNNKQFCGKQ